MPAGVTLDVTADGAAYLLHDATLTVDGTVKAGDWDIRLEDTSNWGIINGSGTIYLEGKGSLLTVSGNKNVANTKIILDGVTLVGVPDNDRPLIEVWGGGTGRSGEFILKSGAITGNTITGNDWVDGGGVRVAEGGIFTMQGGVISGNSAQGTNGGSGGGGVKLDGSAEFTMKDGAISGNTAQSGDQSWGGGVRVEGNHSTFTMEGGTIYGKTDSLANIATDNAALDADQGTVKWGMGGYYTKGGVSQPGGSDIGNTDDTLIAVK